MTEEVIHPRYAKLKKILPEADRIRRERAKCEREVINAAAEDKWLTALNEVKG